MAVIGLDLGGTKLSAAIFDRNGNISLKTIDHLADRKGKDVGKMIVDQTGKFLNGARENNLQIDAIIREAKKWAQPLSIRHVQLEVSALGTYTALYGAGSLASRSLGENMKE